MIYSQISHAEIKMRNRKREREREKEKKRGAQGKKLVAINIMAFWKDPVSAS